MSDFRWLVERSIYRNSVDILVVEDRNGQRVVGQPTEIIMEAQPGGVFAEHPTLSISEDAGQQLMNELWREGFRPRDGSGAIAHVESMQRHLDDMRRIVAGKLKIELAP